MKESHFRTFCANFVIVSVLLMTFGIAFVASYPKDVQSKAVNNAIYQGNENGGSVALMFNVYENKDNVLSIATILEKYGYNATFFVGGSWVAKNQTTLLKIATAGFEIGNHGYLHRDHARLSYDDNKKEIRVTERLVDGMLSSLPKYQNSHLFAPPSGSIGDNMFKACEDLGYKVIMWTRDTIDWRDHDVQVIYNRAIKDIKSGDLILMHPTDCTVEALPMILDYIKSLGLKADTVSNVISQSKE